SPRACSAPRPIMPCCSTFTASPTFPARPRRRSPTIWRTISTGVWAERVAAAAELWKSRTMTQQVSSELTAHELTAHVTQLAHAADLPLPAYETHGSAGL